MTTDQLTDRYWVTPDPHWPLFDFIFVRFFIGFTAATEAHVVDESLVLIVLFYIQLAKVEEVFKANNISPTFVCLVVVSMIFVARIVL